MNNHWEKELEHLISILQKTELIETVKWGAPAFTYNGKTVVGIAGFKNHFALWFQNGVFLKDKHKRLINAQEGKTKALRQMRFEKAEDIDEKIILAYVHEAIENEKQGKKWKPEKNSELTIPEILNVTFKQDSKLFEAFQKLTLGKQKDYIEYLETAKKEETRLARLEKIKPMILDGKGLNDTYKCG